MMALSIGYTSFGDAKLAVKEVLERYHTQADIIDGGERHK